MAKILCIDTSTEVCSVSLSNNGNTVIVREDNKGRNHASTLTIFIKEIIASQEISLKELDAIAVNCGPGSYTGLRIGVSSAKGLCYALGMPLIAISSLYSMTLFVNNNIENITTLKKEDSFLLCPMIDAKRMEVYTELYDNTCHKVHPTQATIIDAETFTDFLNQTKIVFFGNGSAKCKSLISHPNALFLDDISTSACYLSLPAEKAYMNRKFVDVAYFEPFYLKDFMVTTSKKDVFNLIG